MRRGDVVYVRLPPPDPAAPTRVQQGPRPAVVVQADAHREPPSVVVVVPATTNLLAMKFSCSVLIHPDGSNGLTADSVLLIGQVGPVDATRVVQVLGRLGDNDLALLEENLRLLLGL